MFGPVTYLGDFPYGATIRVPFATYASGGASVTISNFLVADIAVYKALGTTQRSSTNGYTLADTDGIDFDGLTGVHGFSIDTSDNSVAGFFAPGNDYQIVVGPFTKDAQTVHFVYAFSIENRFDPLTIFNTTIASLSSQTSFTLTAGPAENDALNDCIVVVQAASSATQKAIGRILDYVGASKTVTLALDPGVFTMATGDYIRILAPDPFLSAIKTKTDLIPGTQDGYTFAELMLVMASVLAGKVSGMGTTAVAFRALDDSQDRVTATVDEHGNRSSVTRDTSSP